MRQFTPIFLLLYISAMVSPLAAQDTADDHAAAVAAANNPLGIGIGKVVKSGRSVFNIFFEPQFTILHDGQGYPAFQIFAGINLQLLSK